MNRIRNTTFALVATALLWCGNVTARGTDLLLPVDTPGMKYTTVEPPNAEGFAKVSLRKGDDYAEGIIDGRGNEVIAPRTDMLVNNITGTVALVQVGRQFLFVDLDRGPVDATLLGTTIGYQYAEPFAGGHALVQVDDVYFFIDPDGNRSFGATYDFAESFLADRALVKQGEQYSVIDTAGHVVSILKYDQVGPYSPQRWQVTTIKGDVYWSGFVDRNGTEVVPPIYTEVSMYQPEVQRAIAGIDDKLGYLDELGNVAIPIHYTYAEIFDKGKARVGQNGRVFFIDREGKEVE